MPYTPFDPTYEESYNDVYRRAALSEPSASDSARYLKSGVDVLSSLKDVASIPKIGGKLASLGRFGNIAGKLKNATPWAAGGTALSILGSKIGKRNYRTGGAMSGAGKGAAMGATIGSVIPGLGTVAGGLIGGAIGGIKGFFGGKARKEAQHKIDVARNDEYEAGATDYLTKKYNDPNFVPRTASERLLKAQSPEDQAAIIKSWGNRDAVEEWGGGVPVGSQGTKTKLTEAQALPFGYSVGPYGEDLSASQDGGGTGIWSGRDYNSRDYSKLDYPDLGATGGWTDAIGADTKDRLSSYRQAYLNRDWERA